MPSARRSRRCAPASPSTNKPLPPKKRAALLLFPLPLRKITRPPFCSAPLLRPRARGFPLPRGKPTQSKEDGKKARYRKRAPACKKTSSFLGRTLLCFGFAGAGRPRAGPSVALGGHRALSAQTRQARHFSLFQLAPLGAPAPDVALLPVQKLLRFSPALPKPAAPCPAFHGALLSEEKRVWAQKIRLLGKEPDFSFL